MKNIDVVLQRLKQYRMRLRKEKCNFLSPSVDFSGHVFYAEGHQPVENKLQTIKQEPIPRNVKEFRSFLELPNYFGSFMSNLSSLLHPLNN